MEEKQQEKLSQQIFLQFQYLSRLHEPQRRQMQNDFQLFLRYRLRIDKVSNIEQGLDLLN
jgi:hypothetical protein